jgi:hypothetical protein
MWALSGAGHDTHDTLCVSCAASSLHTASKCWQRKVSDKISDKVSTLPQSTQYSPRPIHYAQLGSEGKAIHV